MSIPNPDPGRQDPPQWAVDEAADELGGVDDEHAVTARAREIARERHDERHDEYDDPDEGGEG